MFFGEFSFKGEISMAVRVVRLGSKGLNLRIAPSFWMAFWISQHGTGVFNRVCVLGGEKGNVGAED